MPNVGIIILPASKELTVWELVKDEYVVLLPPGTQLEGDALTWEALAKQPTAHAPNRLHHDAACL